MQYLKKINASLRNMKNRNSQTEHMIRHVSSMLSSLDFSRSIANQCKRAKNQVTAKPLQINCYSLFYYSSNINHPLCPAIAFANLWETFSINMQWRGVEVCTHGRFLESSFLLCVSISTWKNHLRQQKKAFLMHEEKQRKYHLFCWWTAQRSIIDALFSLSSGHHEEANDLGRQNAHCGNGP